MLTREAIAKVFKQWELAGLISPARTRAQAEQLLTSFQQEFAFMDEDTLRFVASRLCTSPVWPTFGVIRQAAHEHLEAQNQYVYIDYFSDKSKEAYGEDESFEDFIQRTARTYFPSWPEEWIAKHRFILHYYGVVAHSCKHCDGHCLHHGHQYFLRIKKGTSFPVPYASIDICPKYRDAAAKPVEQPTSKAVQPPIPEDDDYLPDEKSAPYVEEHYVQEGLFR